jgi:hypothetical protein
MTRLFSDKELMAIFKIDKITPLVKEFYGLHRSSDDDDLYDVLNEILMEDSDSSSDYVPSDTDD